ncbi:uncharacterized protein EV420DRAFT_1481605 [Desarmillaria tabescens]|uniref:Oxidation resistance protein 1 n=1 Tax=Armillaria tabescens TaxID=1929756 RepID=A0AA39K448_ARMTA|nr:uncharacterized protein EV420DRAFT_1481605 [Desarmillaria tabescens]KAK0454165.1 hypothetical protein EV420DRAFT_1481605 [Desarmillaria tabescens]
MWSFSPSNSFTKTSSLSSSLVSITPVILVPQLPLSYTPTSSTAMPAPHSSASETSSVVYISPTGAPGYHGEGYDWDIGFSKELERVLGNKEHRYEKALWVELRGRRECTAGMLNAVLANMIQPRLPALSHLARIWTLLYSLDQHGISLNALYSLSEQPKPAGALVVIKDDGDTIFSAFLGDGIRQSRGRGYYGSGESYSNCKLSVYKPTGRNSYIALCEPDYLSFGGGDDGVYGLYVDKSCWRAPPRGLSYAQTLEVHYFHPSRTTSARGAVVPSPCLWKFDPFLVLICQWSMHFIYLFVYAYAWDGGIYYWNWSSCIFTGTSYGVLFSHPG